jgi:hypothetical protein
VTASKARVTRPEVPELLAEIRVNLVPLERLAASVAPAAPASPHLETATGTVTDGVAPLVKTPYPEPPERRRLLRK